MKRPEKWLKVTQRNPHKSRKALRCLIVGVSLCHLATRLATSKGSAGNFHGAIMPPLVKLPPRKKVQNPRTEKFCYALGPESEGSRDLRPPLPGPITTPPLCPLRDYRATGVRITRATEGQEGPATILRGLRINQPRQSRRGAASNLGTPGRPMHRRRSVPPARAGSAVGGSAAGLIHRARSCPRSGAIQ